MRAPTARSLGAGNICNYALHDPYKSDPKCTLEAVYGVNKGRDPVQLCTVFFFGTCQDSCYAVSCQAASEASASHTESDPEEHNVSLSRSYHYYPDGLALYWLAACCRTSLEPARRTPAWSTQCRKTECRAGSAELSPHEHATC